MHLCWCVINDNDNNNNNDDDDDDDGDSGGDDDDDDGDDDGTFTCSLDSRQRACSPYLHRASYC